MCANEMKTKRMINSHLLSSDKNLLHYGGSSIVCAFGVRYKSYCSNIVRTLLVNPSKDMESHYGFLLECEEIIINTLQHSRDFYSRLFND